MTRFLAIALLLVPAGTLAQGFDVPLLAEKKPSPAPADPDETIRAGFSLEIADAGPVVGQVLPDSAVDELGLVPGDSLWYFNGERVASRADADAALASWTPGTRLSAVVSRAHRVAALASPATAPKPREKRDSRSLTLREKRLRSELLKAAGKRPPAGLKAPAFPVKEGETLWIRFPKGLPRSLTRGMVVEAETATALTTDAELDFAAIPQGSRVWAQVVAEDSVRRVRSVRLHAYKIRLAGGGSYPLSALVDDVSGDRSLLRAGPDGTIAAALEDKDELIAGPERRFRLRLLRPFTVAEPRSFYRAGPGLWFKSVGKDKTKAFEITHIIPGRSAERAGLKVGDRIYRIDQAWAIKLDFAGALDRLYGTPGSELELRAARKMGSEIERFTLRRGVRYVEDAKEPIVLPPPLSSSALTR